MAARGPRRGISVPHLPDRSILIPFQWIGLFAMVTVFAVMFAFGLMLGREQIAAALQRRVVLAARYARECRPGASVVYVFSAW